MTSMQKCHKVHFNVTVLLYHTVWPIQHLYPPNNYQYILCPKKRGFKKPVFLKPNQVGFLGFGFYWVFHIFF